ncbi:hypothetical protein MVEN_02625600 [Mycena venus]|uniref:Uncharacterized protein n=1 Tax=Mycena venus TaxID=2733690 RepID=A0A8H6TZ95_9AGAR|nr:hypothetical protein MVEN_02625600 [Mycena venus]
MSTKRRVGVSSATTEAARRAVDATRPFMGESLGHPRSRASRLNIASLPMDQDLQDSSFWTQHFSDDEGEADEPLAPLPDEVEVVDGDEEDQDETAAAAPVPDVTEVPVPEEEPPSKPASPKPQLSMGLQPSGDLDDPDTNSALDESLQAMETNMAEGVGVGLDTDEGLYGHIIACAGRARIGRDPRLDAIGRVRRIARRSFANGRV